MSMTKEEILKRKNQLMASSQEPDIVAEMYCIGHQLGYGLGYQRGSENNIHNANGREDSSEINPIFSLIHKNAYDEKIILMQKKIDFYESRLTYVKNKINYILSENDICELEDIRNNLQQYLDEGLKIYMRS